MEAIIKTLLVLCMLSSSAFAGDLDYFGISHANQKYYYCENVAQLYLNAADAHAQKMPVEQAYEYAGTNGISANTFHYLEIKQVVDETYSQPYTAKIDQGISTRVMTQCMNSPG